MESVPKATLYLSGHGSKSFTPDPKGALLGSAPFLFTVFLKYFRLHHHAWMSNAKAVTASISNGFYLEARPRVELG